jgi:triacylglycerol lipase
MNDSTPLSAIEPSSIDDPFLHDPSVERVYTPIWLEARWATEWMRLKMSPVYWGWGIPHGKGQPVLLVPGFLAGDWMMLELGRWLKRIGYRPYHANIVWNTDCPDLTAKRLEQRAQSIARREGQKIRLVGHSLGGMLSKYVVQESPQIVDRVVTMGSPFRDLVKAHPAVVGIWDKLKLKRSSVVGRNLKPSCGTGHCTCTFVRNMMLPKKVSPAQFAIFSKKDGVVEWQSCVEENEDHNTAVNGSHIGLIIEPNAYRALARRLAQDIT